MKKKSAIIIGIICLAICVSIIAVLAMKNGSNQYLTNDNGKVIQDSYGNRYLDYRGEPGKTDEQTDSNGQKTYYISGVWQWNSILALPEGMEDGTTELTTLKFQTAKQQHSKMIYVQATFQNRILAALYYTSEENNNAYRFLFGWDNPTDRLVDFGTEPQPVSETFYRFLTENAAPATREDYMDVVTDYVESVEKVTISGYWKWNEVIYPEAMTNNAMYIRIKGTLANRKVAYLYSFSNGVNNGKLELNFAAKEDSIPNFCAWSSTRSTPWDNDKERYIYLGDEEQTITQSEYQFFVANAKPCTKEEFEAAAANADN